MWHFHIWRLCKNFIVKRRLLRVPCTTRRSNQSILKCSLEGLMLKLKLQYFGHLMWRAVVFGKDHNAGKDWGQEEKGTTEDETALLTWWTWVWASSARVGDGQGSLVWYSPWGWVRHNWVNWTELKNFIIHKPLLPA